MKHLKTALLCASLALAAAAQAAGNPHRESYGTWEETLVKNGQASAERFVIATSAPLQEALAKISADKKYLRVNLSLSCADGAMSFIQLDRNDGLKMYAAPDVYHFPVKRVQ